MCYLHIDVGCAFDFVMGWLLLETGQKDNVVKFFQNFRGFYDDELKASNTCFARKN